MTDPDPRWGKAPGPPIVSKFLEGPQPRRFETWSALEIFRGLVRGFRALPVHLVKRVRGIHQHANS